MKRKRARRSIWFVFLFLVSIGMALPVMSGTNAFAADKVRLSMGGASTGTWIYMFSAIMVDVWKRYIPELDITLMATGGTTAHYAPVDKGEMDLAGAATFGDYWAINGMYFAKSKLTNFCSLIPAGKAFNHGFTYADSPIKTWKEMEGKRIALGARASPTSILNEEIFKILGIKANFVYSTPTEAIGMMKDKRVDAMAYSVGAPWSSIMDIAADRPLKLIPLKPEEQKKIAEALPYQIPDTIPAKTYSFQNEDTPVVIGFQHLIVRPGLSEELVYKLTKVAWERWDEVVKGTSAAKWVKAGDIVHMIAPVHPGAARYYKEVGIQIPDRLIWKKK